MVPAHATLFHALPGEAEGEALGALLEIGAPGGFAVEVTGVRSLGRGVAFTLASETLAERRAMVARRFAGRLTRQDAQGWRPHVTVQNKVTAGEARALLASLSASFVPERVEAGAFHLWRYLGGPWEPVSEVRLAG